MQRLVDSWGRPPKKLHHPRIIRRRSRRRPEGLRRTAPSRCPRRRPGRHRYRALSGHDGKPSRRIERARGVEIARDHTSSHDPSFVFAISEPPTRLSEESQSLRRRFPFGFDAEGGERHKTLGPLTTVDCCQSRARGKPRGPSVPIWAIASDPAPMSRLRCRESSHQNTRESVTAVRRSQTSNATNKPAMTTSSGPADKTLPPEGNDRNRPKAGRRRLSAGIKDTFPRFIAFRRSEMRRSLIRWFASPTPSALRVFHPLSGLIPAHPRGCVSSHFRP